MCRRISYANNDLGLENFDFETIVAVTEQSVVIYAFLQPVLDTEGASWYCHVSERGVLPMGPWQSLGTSFQDTRRPQRALQLNSWFPGLLLRQLLLRFRNLEIVATQKTTPRNTHYVEIQCCRGISWTYCINSFCAWKISMSFFQITYS